jgi:hypothetical protein
MADVSSEHRRTRSWHEAGVWLAALTRVPVHRDER